MFPGNKLAVWAGVDAFPAAGSAAFAQRVEAMGYDALWIPEGPGREVMASSAWLLANTKKLVVASGIANIYARDAMASVGAQHTLNEQSGGRFVLGLGVSHVPLVKGLRQHEYGAPVPTMRAYLQAMAGAAYMGPRGPGKPLTILAALGPKMLALAAELADGAHPYNVTPEHTAQAREILGKGKLLLVEQKCILETDAAKARALGRQALAIYLGLPNYVNTWKRLGFTDADVAGGGSDRLIDAMFAWGDEKAIRSRLEAHWQAGADQVCVQAIGQMQGMLALPDEKLLGLLVRG